MFCPAVVDVTEDLGVTAKLNVSLEWALEDRLTDAKRDHSG